MQVMSTQMLDAAREFLREADGDLRLVQRAMVAARTTSGQEVPPLREISQKVSELVARRKGGDL